MGCTGVWQMCNVDIRRIFSFETLILQRCCGNPGTDWQCQHNSNWEVVGCGAWSKCMVVMECTLDTKQTWNHEEASRCTFCSESLKLILLHQAVQMYCTSSFTLLYESLSSHEARQNLWDLKWSDPEFWTELPWKAIPEVKVGVEADLDRDNEAIEILRHSSARTTKSLSRSLRVVVAFRATPSLPVSLKHSQGM